MSVVKKSNLDPKKSPRLFLKILKQRIPRCKRKTSLRVLRFIVGDLSSAELNEVAIKATKRRLGKKAAPKRISRQAKDVFKLLRALRAEDQKKSKSLIDLLD